MLAAFRLLLKSPGFTAAAVLVLALGIGANTAIFSVVNATLLRPLPFPDADRLVRVYEAFDEPDTRANTLNLSELTLRQWREQGRGIFSGVGAATGGSVTLGAHGGGSARNFPAARITADFFSTLGLQPALGRNFTAEEDRPGGPRVAIVAHDFWQRELGGRADVLGQTLTLDNAAFTIVGVMPKNFRHPYRAAIWTPLGAAYATGSRGHYLYGAARLQPGLTLAQADAAIRRLCAAINAAAPDPANPRRAYIRPLREGFVADLQPKLLVIAAAAACTLLIAAANFAGLLLARAVAREGETAVRAALGASRVRLVRETLTQALALALLGTIVGLLFAMWLTPALVALSPEGSDATGSAMREFDHAVRLDWPVFAFATGALVLVGAGFGLLPAWRAARTDLRRAMSNGGRSATLDRGTRRVLGALVVGEIAVAAVLLVGSVSFARYFQRLIEAPWGLQTEHRLGFNIMLSPGAVAEGHPARSRALDQILTQLRASPGVESAAATFPHPLHQARSLLSVNVEGHTAAEPRGFHLAYLRATTPGYFGTVGQTLVRGRDFTADDRADTPLVAIVSETFARRFWPGQDPIGQRVKRGRFDSPRPWFTVIGVVADTRAIADPNDGEIVGTVHLAMNQAGGVSNAYEEFTLIAHTTGEPRVFEAVARAALARADSRLAAYEVNSFDAVAAATRTTERFALVLISLFAVLGLVLAAVGLYGLLALQVTRRTREFGVRSALGATAAQLIAFVGGHAARLLLLGLAFGTAGAWAALRFAQSRWPDLPAVGVLPFLAAAAVLATAIAFAAWLPARRAARVDPMTALRAE